FQRTEKEEGYSLSVDLPNQTVRDNRGLEYKFEIAPARKEVLLKGLDDIGTTMQHAAAIDAYEKVHTATATMYDPVHVKYYSNARSAPFPPTSLLLRSIRMFGQDPESGV